MGALSILILFALIFLAIFLILVVLVQRGRGGGLAGALGGMGGQSAFGTKAGDTFTKITIWTAVVWILLCVIGVKYLSSQNSAAQHTLPGGSADESTVAPRTGAGAPASKPGTTNAPPARPDAPATPANSPPPPPAPAGKTAPAAPAGK